MTRSNAPAASSFSAFFAFSSGIGQLSPGHIEQTRSDCRKSIRPFALVGCNRVRVLHNCHSPPATELFTRVVSSGSVPGRLHVRSANFSIMRPCAHPAMRLLMSPACAGAISAAATVSSELPELGDSSSAVVSLEMEQEIGKQLLRQVHAEVPTDQRSDAEVLHRDAALQPRRTLGTEAQAAVPGVDRRAGDQRIRGAGRRRRHQSRPVSRRRRRQRILGGARARTGAPEPTPLRAADRNAAADRRCRISRRCSHRSSLPPPTGGEAGHRGDVRHPGSSHKQNQLQFSREREAEADRIGINTLAAADLDPAAMAKMFEQMQRAYRFSRRPPEFLLTHPVTEARISDARNQAAEYPAKLYPDSEEFQMMRARAMVHYAPTPAAGRRTVQSARRTHRRRRLGVLRSGHRLVARGRPRRRARHREAAVRKTPGFVVYTWRPKRELLNAAGRYDDAIEVLSASSIDQPREQTAVDSVCRCAERREALPRSRGRAARQSVLQPGRHRHLVSTSPKPRASPATSCRCTSRAPSISRASAICRRASSTSSTRADWSAATTIA